MRFLLLLFALCLALQRLHASTAEEWLVRTWQTDDGLPNNDVTCVAQHADGGLLISTRGGLARFDGLRFHEVGHGGNAFLAGRDGTMWEVSRGRILRERPGQQPQVLKIPELNVGGSRETAFFEDAQGVVWISYENGRFLRIVNGTVVQAPVRGGLSEVFASCAALDSTGRVWASGTRVLAAWRDGAFEPVAQLPKDRCVMASSASGGLWIGAGDKLLRYDESSGVQVVGSLEAAPPGTRITCLHEDQHGRLWIGTFGAGLWLREADQLTSLVLPNSDVWWLAEDREGSMWVATGGGGLCRVRPRVLHLFDANASLRGAIVRSLCGDSRGNLWLSTQSAQLWLRRGQSWQWLEPRLGWPGVKAMRVGTGAQGRVWIGSGEGELVCWNGSVYENVALPADAARSVIYALFESREEELWVARGYSVLKGRPGSWKDVPLPSDSLSAQVFAQDSQGYVWAGTMGGMLLQERQGRFERVGEAELGPACQGVRALLPLADGALLIGTQGAGLAYCKAGTLRCLSLAQGLPHAVVSQLALDAQGRVWMAGDAGILMVPYAEIQAVVQGRRASVNATSFGRNEGIGGLQANASTPGILLEENGTLWISTRSGLVTVDTARVGTNTVPPLGTIESLRVNGAEPQWIERQVYRSQDLARLVLPAGVHSLSFDLGAGSFVAPENVRLRYQLMGLDAEPRMDSGERRAVYGYVPPGLYELRVSAANNDGVWSQQATVLPLEVLPFYYETAWFRLLVALAAVAAVTWLGFRLAQARYRRRTEDLRRQAALDAERTRIARDMHDQIGASLTQISLLSDIALAQGASIPQLPRLADTARQAVASLDEIVWAVDPKQDRFDSLLEYLAPQVTELTQAAGLRCRLDFPEEVVTRALPAHFRHQVFLVIREAVNNSLKHAQASELRLRVASTTTHLEVEVCDDGRGLASDAPRGHGLENMRARVVALGGVFEITAPIAGGTRVHFTVPWPVA